MKLKKKINVKPEKIIAKELEIKKKRL